MFGHLRQCAKKIVPDIEVEFYLITSGMVEIARHTCIADEFTSMWGCEFHYNKSGEIEFVKQVVSHTEKTRYLFQVAKGINNQNQDGQMFVYRDVSPDGLTCHQWVMYSVAADESSVTASSRRTSDVEFWDGDDQIK
jgi:hypothetical protein